MIIAGWKLNRIEWRQPTEKFPPLWPYVVADHVTRSFCKLASGDLPDVVRASILAHVADRPGLQVLVVEIDVTTTRPDGGTYHITWSVGRKAGRQQGDSNKVLARLGREKLEMPLPIDLIPANWK